MSKPVIRLIKEGGDTVVATACGKCGLVAHSHELAEQCCEPRVCACGATAGRYSTMCQACSDKKASKAEQARFEKAAKISCKEYDGPIYSDYDCEYHSSVDDLLDVIACDTDEGEELAVPVYVWACTKFGLRLNAEDIIDSAIERDDHHEDARDGVGGVDELQKLLDGWLKEHDIESWMVDYSLAVLLK